MDYFEVSTVDENVYFLWCVNVFHLEIKFSLWKTLNGIKIQIQIKQSILFQMFSFMTKRQVLSSRWNKRPYNPTYIIKQLRLIIFLTNLKRM